MKGCISVSWGAYGGFYLHPKRVCLGRVAFTWLPKIEIDDLMHAYAEKLEAKAHA